MRDMSVERYLHFKGMKQRHVAESLGISQGHFSEMIHGKKPISLRQARRLSELIGAPLDVVADAFLAVQDEIEGK